MQKRALAGREKVLGPEHPDTLESVNNLAGIYGAQGRYREAEPLYNRALKGNETALGPEHPTTLISVSNLAFVFQALGDYGQAVSLLKRAVASGARR